ncbi:hypothetical protein ABL78_4952 [Leptomonas seymouri]|uniref:RCC1-like domain-containing protein n=1 Tax=Leptomonas seymouri TaxID=5684 RepID=A0A0N1HXI8_LEPSE|nr:hypothetical protein ABL78_4952 [Leptomonas seymouri]|eukprot:KPI85990.1 hypothetical protein ABL78_4952 [Leptomonas seymouri]
MEAACRRLCEGDISSLVDIVNFIDARKSHEPHRLGTRALTAIINILIQEGAELRHTHCKDYGLPSPNAFFAIRVLAQLGIRQSEDGLEVQRALIVLGLQRCRDLCLDAYFGLGRAQRYYVIMFVNLLTILYGCTPEDLVRSETSINILTGSSNSGQSPRIAAGAVSSVETVAHASPLLNSSISFGNVAGGASSRAGNPWSSLRSTPSPPPPRDGGSNSSRPANIQNRSALLVSIPGASFDIPLRVTRRYRDLPKKPINAPFAVNPLYEVPSGLGGHSATGHANAPRRPNTAVPLLPQSAPLASSTAPETTIPAQFPIPVVLFSSYYGLGCVPRLPTAEDLARLDAWRQERKQRPPVPCDMLKSVIKTGRGFAESGDMGRELGRMRLLALRSNPSDSALEAELQSYKLQNEHNFVAANGATSPHRRQCLQSRLLQQYINSGKLLSWGSSSKGALGPLRQRRSRSALAHSQRATVDARTSSLPTDALESRRKSASHSQKRSNSSRSSSSSQKISSKACTGTTTAAGSLGGGTAHPSKGSARSTPPMTTAGKTVAPMPNTVTATPDRQSGASVAGAAAATHAERSSCNAAPSSPSHVGYVYLPTPVNTTLRVASIACGLSVTYVVTVDGVLYSCGRGENGQLGIGERCLRYADTGISRLQRVLLKEDETLTHVAAGTACAAALAGDRAFYCWGHNVYGQCLKLPDFSRVLTPTRLKTSVRKVLDICFGQFFGVLLFDDGIMGTWGIASMLGCTIGDKDLEESLASDQCKCARQVVHLELGADCPMTAVRAGPWHALSISKRGEVYTWGVGRDGRLGHGTDSAEVKPRLVDELRSCFAVDASCASAHTAVLTSTGSVYVFGENASGQLGLRGRSPRCLPMAMPLPGKAVAVACAREHTCVLLEDGDVVACGSYRTCGVGLGYGIRICAPVRILTNYISLTLQCGHFHSLTGVLHRRTALMIVGHSTIDEVSRISSVMVRNGVCCAASGVGFLVVLSENSSLVSIGRGERGQLGIGDCMKPASSDDVTVTPKFTSVHLPSGVAIQHLRCGPDYVVALDEAGTVYGWGSNEHQKLCQPAHVDYVYAPVELGGYGQQHRIVQVACGGSFMIALTAVGNVLAHGEAVYCGLGRNVRDSRKLNVSTPTVIPTLHDVVAIAAGRRHAVAMTASCMVFAWGMNVLSCEPPAATSQPFTSTAFTPVRVALSQNIRTIGCGAYNSFAITEEGELWVWGVNTYGECGVPPNRQGDVSAAARPQQQRAGGAASPDGAARILQTPISVARQVRDAAFTSQFGLVVFEDGQVRVSGRVRHGGRKYLLPSFHSNPQPCFSIDVNEPVPQRCQGRDSTAFSELPRAELAQPPCTTKHDILSLGDEDEDDSDDEDALNGSTHSSVESGMVPQLMHASASTRVPSATEFPENQARAELKRLPVEEPDHRLLSARPVVSQREPADTTHCLTSSDDQAGPRVGGSSRTVAEPPTLNTAINASSSRLPQIRASSGQSSKADASTAVDCKAVAHSSTGAAPRSRSPSSHEVSTAEMPAGEAFVFGPSPPPPSHFSPTAAGAVQAAEETAASSTPHADLNAKDTCCGPEVPHSPDLSVLSNRIFPEAADGSPLHALLPANKPNVSLKKAAMATLAPSSSLPSLSRPPPASPPPRGASRPAHYTVQTVSDPPKAQSSSLIDPTHLSTAITPAVDALPAPSGSSSNGAAATSEDTRLTTPSTNVPNIPTTEDKGIFGIRCFAGWDQICVVMEKHRPSVKEVRLAQDGLRALLR